MIVSKRALVRYAGSVVVIILATLTRLALEPILQERGSLITYFIAVSLVAWLGGLGPGLLSLVLGGVVSTYLFMPHRYTFFDKKPENVIGLVFYLITGLIITLMAEAQRSARRRAEASALEAIDRQTRLEAEIVRREQVERERAVLLAEQARLRAIAEEQSATLATLLDQAPIAIAFYDSDLRHIRANHKAAAMIGLTPDQVMGRTIREVLDGTMPDVKIDELERPYHHALETGEPFSIKAWDSGIKRPGGDSTYLEWSVRRVDRPEGGTLGLLGTFIDVTEDIQAEQALREADARKNDFLAVLAHEIRNPLASISASLRLMKRPAGDTEANGQAARFDPESEREMAERQVVHLARLVEDLMDVSRISRGRVELRKMAIELACPLERAIQAIRPSIDRRGHSLSVDLPDAPIRLEADPTRLEQVFGNLLSNAVKYTPPGGRIEVWAREEAGEAVLTVRDTGLGLSAEMLPKVFEMFVQDGKHAGHAQGGLGIGLGLSKSLVELHGGRISARSEGPGSGSEFEVRLPLATGGSLESGTSNRNGRSARRSPAPRRRVLVVDDNESLARSLARLLERMHGQEVRVAHDGASALELADEFQPELILLDIGMPEMDGCELARRIRRRPEFAETVLVALTGWGQDEDRKRSEEAGIDRHLVKPIDPDILGDLIAASR